MLNPVLYLYRKNALLCFFSPYHTSYLITKCVGYFSTHQAILYDTSCVCVCVCTRVSAHAQLLSWAWLFVQPTRLLCPWGFPGKNSGVNCHYLFQGIFPTQELNLHLLHCRRILYCRDTRKAAVPEFNSILTLTTWSWYQISQVKAQSPLQTPVASLRLSSALLTYQLEIGIHSYRTQHFFVFNNLLEWHRTQWNLFPGLL